MGHTSLLDRRLEKRPFTKYVRTIGVNWRSEDEGVCPDNRHERTDRRKYVRFIGVNAILRAVARRRDPTESMSGRSVIEVRWWRSEARRSMSGESVMSGASGGDG